MAVRLVQVDNKASSKVILAVEKVSSDCVKLTFDELFGKLLVLEVLLVLDASESRGYFFLLLKFPESDGESAFLGVNELLNHVSPGDLLFLVKEASTPTVEELISGDLDVFHVLIVLDTVFLVGSTIFYILVVLIL
jgi:hypothetical protein